MPDPVDTTKVYTIEDWIKLKDEDYAGVVHDVLTSFPLFQGLPSITIEGTAFKHPIVDGLPSGGLGKTKKIVGNGGEKRKTGSQTQAIQNYKQGAAGLWGGSAGGVGRRSAGERRGVAAGAGMGSF